MKILLQRCSFWPRGSGSVLIVDGKVERVAKSESQPAPDNATVLDAAWGTLLPGLIDTHCHPFELGWLKRNLDLRGTSNITALRMRVAAKAQGLRPGEWIEGMGWDHEAFAERRLPNMSDIDDVSRNNPVILSRVCGHIGLLNSKAIESLGIGDVRGAEYDRNDKGELTGIIRERALVEAYSRVPGSSAGDCAADLSVVEFEAAKSGLTCLHSILSPDNYREELEALLSLATSGKLLLRHRVFVPPEEAHLVVDVNRRLEGSRARVNGVKLFCDGSLGAGTAALREPYSDEPSNSGSLRYSDEELAQQVAKADSLGLQVIVHAIGDRAIEQAIDALSVVTGAGNPLRHRIEHASLLPKDLRSKAKKHRIRLTVQPSFITSDVWAEKRLGSERVRDLYPLKSILSEGIVASGGSDAPVESLNPILGMWSSIAGRISPESLDLDGAQTMYTLNAASNGFDDPSFVKEGSTGNFTLLDSDVREIHPALLRKVGVAATIVGGELAYSSID